MNNFGTYYLERCEQASKDQGIDLLVKELKALGIDAEIEQTGGFTMCAYIEINKDRYIYANSYGAGIYDEEGFIEDIYLNETEADELARTKEVAKALTNWIKENK